jgi:hypothetical protein
MAPQRGVSLIGWAIADVVEVLEAKGPVTAKTGKLVTTLPEKGRAEAVAKFAKACALD